MKKTLFFGLASLLILLFSGCSWKTDFAQNDAKKTSQLTNITIPVPFLNDPEQGYIFIAKDQGYFSKAGLNLNWTENLGSSITTKLIGSGEYPIGLATTAVAMIAKSKGVPLTMTAILEKVNTVGIICHQDANVSKPEDLYGKTLGAITTSSNYQQYLIFAKNENLDQSKITEVPMTGPDADFIANKVNCVAGHIEQVEAAAQIKNIPTTHLSMKDHGLDIYGTGVFVNSDFLKQNPELVKKATRALVQGLQYQNAHPAEALDIFLKMFPDKSGLRDFYELKLKKYDEIENSLPSGISRDDGIIDPAVIERQKELFIKTGFIPDNFDTSTFYSNDYLK